MTAAGADVSRATTSNLDHDPDHDPDPDPDPDPDLDLDLDLDPEVVRSVGRTEVRRMAPSAKEVRAAELARLRDWCLLVLQVYREAMPSFDRERTIEPSIEAVYAMRSLAGLRAGQRDLLRMVQNNLDPAWQAKLDERLRARFVTTRGTAC